MNEYSKCSKISNLIACQKDPRQAGQTQIRLLLKKQSDQGLPCLLFWPAFYIQDLKKNRKRKVVKILDCRSVCLPFSAAGIW